MVSTAESRRREARAWAAVVLWSALIFVSVPVARGLRDQVNALLGAKSLGYLTIAVILLAAGATVVVLLGRLRKLGWQAAAWIAAVAAALVVWTFHLWEQPEEAVHLIEYGVLSMLATNALRRQSPDRSVFVQAALFASAVGVADEISQWVNPSRYFGFRDIAINSGAAILVQIALWQGVMRGPRPPVSARSLARCCGLGIVFLLLLGLTLTLTPARVERWGEGIPWLQSLNDHKDAMGEFGELHEVAELGRFKSRFTLDQLLAIDAAEAPAAAAVMSPKVLPYSEFLATSSRLTQAFPREARIHLASRNRQLRNARTADCATERRVAATVAWRENQILERYFGATLRHAEAELDPPNRDRLEAWADPELAFSSKVDRHLITWIGEAQALGLVGSGILILAVIAIAAHRRARS